MQLYDTIGKTYARTRRADPRITARLVELLALPPASTIADIGAGTGNYSLELARSGFHCLAIEPSMTMAKQAEAHPSVQWFAGSAESIPLPDQSVAACVSLLSYHHFQDRRRALSELLRIAGSGPLVFFTFCPQRLSAFWLCEYFPSMLAEARSCFHSAETTVDEMERSTGRRATLHEFLLPFDLVDGFAAAAWRCPERYLDPEFRQGISSFAKVPLPELQSGLARLASAPLHLCRHTDHMESRACTADRWPHRSPHRFPATSQGWSIPCRRKTHTTTKQQSRRLLRIVRPLILHLFSHKTGQGIQVRRV